MSIWDEPGKLLVPGDVVKLTKGYANIWRNTLTLYAGKNGEIFKLGEFCFAFNEQLNMSDPALAPPTPPIAALSNNSNNGTANNGNHRVPPQQQSTPPVSMLPATTNSTRASDPNKPPSSAQNRFPINNPSTEKPSNPPPSKSSRTGRSGTKK